MTPLPLAHEQSPSTATGLATPGPVASRSPAALPAPQNNLFGAPTCRRRQHAAAAPNGGSVVADVL
jgi:hypothetical protein